MFLLILMEFVNINTLLIKKVYIIYHIYENYF